MNHLIERKKIMSFEDFRAGINRLAAEELDGADIEADIVRLAAAAKVSSSDVRAAITEALQDA